ncbi:MAG TPA: GNAT family N-acetyltransferase [Candidatus Dormibacteraeota bacterium]|nr:GNAT family N-acetyltransferase [Candidatus Dormibacteraeota bacterium]
MREDLAAGGGAIAWQGDAPVGCLRFDVEPDHLHVRRVAVAPARRRSGIGTALMQWAHGYAASRGLREVRLGVRVQLPGNVAFYKKLGYEVVASHRHPRNRRVFWREMRLRLPA